MTAIAQGTKNVLDNTEPIDPDDPSQARVRKLLKDTQGNILKAHGRDHSRHLFLCFDKDVGAARTWLSGLASTRVTSAMTQWEQSRDRARKVTEATAVPEPRHRTGERLATIDKGSDVFVTVMLSAKGYDRLGAKKAMPKDDESFKAGARAETVRQKLNDPPLDTWDQKYNRDLHALVILAHDDESVLDKATEDMVKSLADGRAGNVVHRENGHVMRRAPAAGTSGKGPVIEHFGFLDGISNPLFFRKDVDAANGEKDRGNVTDPRYCSPFASLNLALLPDPGARDGGAGSYFVYRKLRQDVVAFKRDRDDLAERLRTAAGAPEKSTAWYRDLAGAYVMGRFPDGTPLVEQAEPGLGAVNRFDFGKDVDGVMCPFASHMRKTNPRGDVKLLKKGSLDDERRHRIVRRGVNYGRHTLDPKPGEDLGLLFMCVQSSIVRQFEFVRHDWCDQKDFPFVDSGMDPMIGHSLGERKYFQKWPTKRGDRGKENLVKDYSIGPWVTLRGAEYFFVPSVSMLKSLGSAR